MKWSATRAKVLNMMFRIQRQKGSTRGRRGQRESAYKEKGRFHTQSLAYLDAHVSDHAHPEVGFDQPRSRGIVVLKQKCEVIKLPLNCLFPFMSGNVIVSCSSYSTEGYVYLCPFLLWPQTGRAINTLEKNDKTLRCAQTSDFAHVFFFLLIFKQSSSSQIIHLPCRCRIERS